MANAAPDTPVTDAELDGLFGPLTAWPLIALAVSGGPDSLALLHLFARWRSAHTDAPSALVLTVDHSLRPQSAAEARFVASEAACLGLPHETLLWDGPKPSSGLPNAARDARYRLMLGRLAREALAPRAIITAHTLNDQAETVLMRLARGSGLEGLAGIKPARQLSEDGQVWLVRPLLDVPKSRLEATLSAMGRTWIQDPTNADLAFERPRLRASERVRAAAGMSNAALGLAARRLARANEAIIHMTDALEMSAVRDDPGLSAAIRADIFRAAPLETRIRLLDRLLRRCGGAHPPAHLSEIERLAGQLTVMAQAVTLGGCRIAPGAKEITLTREPGRTGLPVIALEPGQSAVWDNRFEVALAATAPQPCTVRALTNVEWAALPAPVRASTKGGHTARTALTVPSFWMAGVLVAVPDLGPLDQMSVPLRHTACIEQTDLPLLSGPLLSGPLLSGPLLSGTERVCSARPIRLNRTGP